MCASQNVMPGQLGSGASAFGGSNTPIGYTHDVPIKMPAGR